MYKRIIIATILAAAYQKKVMLAPLLCTELVFVIVRYVLEQPEKKKQLWMLFIETMIHVASYLLLFLSMDAGVNTVIISIFIFVLIVVLAYALT